MEDENRTDSSRFCVEQLHGSNYFLWSIELETLLCLKGLYKHVEATAAEAVAIEGKPSFQRKGDLALAHILMTINQSRKASVIALRSPNTIWNKLKKMYQAVSEASMDAMLTKLQSIKLGTSEAINEYANRIDRLVNQLASVAHDVN